MYTDDDGTTVLHRPNGQLPANELPTLLNHTFSAAWNLNVALHYTKGDGYYEEYKPEAAWRSTATSI